MGAAVNFYAGLGDEASAVDLSGSGIGFYGASFGTSVQVGQYQDTSFITNSTGSAQGPQTDNNKYQGDVSGVDNNGDGVTHIRELALESGTVNVRFTNDTAVDTQNGEARIFDRSDINAGASGVTTQVAQLVTGLSGVEPTTGAAQAWDAGEDGWLALSGSGTVMVLLNSPGSGGQGGSGAAGEDTRHDWYLALSASPDSIGSKTLFGLFIQLEFL
jgi:hypothetical protein